MFFWLERAEDCKPGDVSKAIRDLRVIQVVPLCLIDQQSTLGVVCSHKPSPRRWLGVFTSSDQQSPDLKGRERRARKVAYYIYS